MLLFISTQKILSILKIPTIFISCNSLSYLNLFSIIYYRGILMKKVLMILIVITAVTSGMADSDYIISCEEISNDI